MNLFIASLLAASPSADAAIAGYTGLFNVPTAEIRDELSLSFRWIEAPRADLLLTPENTGLVNRTYLISLPLLPFVEATFGALSVSEWFDPGFPHLPTGFHRSVSAKLRVPLVWPGPSFAVGVVDPFSANSFNGTDTRYGLTSYYGVATQRVGPLAISAGYGMGDRRSNLFARLGPFLDGPFGGVVWALPLGLEALAEWDGHALNEGLRWAGPFGFTIEGGRLGDGLTAGVSLGAKL